MFVGVRLGALRACVGWWVSGWVVLGVFFGALSMLSELRRGCSWDLWEYSGVLLGVLWCFRGAIKMLLDALDVLLGSLLVLLGCSCVLFCALGVFLGWFGGALGILLACSLDALLVFF